MAKLMDARVPPDDLGSIPDLDPSGPDGSPRAVLGIEIETAAKTRTSLGTYEVNFPRYWMHLSDIEVTLLPISRDGRLQKPDNRRFQIANEFSTGVYQIDSRRAFIGLETAQRMLNLEPGVIADPQALEETGEVVPIGVDPARVQMVLVRAAEGVSPATLQKAVRETYDRFAAQVLEDDSLIRKAPSPIYVGVQTWRQQLRDIIGPVEKERELMRILFSIVYLVCAGLVLSIFWAIVYEKTRDIGILRAVGASRPGILGIFLAYGLVIGLAGSCIGAFLGWLVTDNINLIHEAMGQTAPAWTWILAFLLAILFLIVAIWNMVRGSMLKTLLSVVGIIVFVGLGIALYLHQGFLMWDPRVYYFNRIPSQVDWFSAVLTMAGAIIFSVLGAAIPAARAADTDPVRALRYE